MPPLPVIVLVYFIGLLIPATSVFRLATNFGVFGLAVFLFAFNC